eukprot:scaffold573_cov46-Phaeocystis_antarctica.AAC.1
MPTRGRASPCSRRAPPHPTSPTHYCCRRQPLQQASCPIPKHQAQSGAPRPEPGASQPRAASRASKAPTSADPLAPPALRRL